MQTAWRRGWDSNPRYPCGYAAFRVRCDRPLCHLSSLARSCEPRKLAEVPRRCNSAVAPRLPRGGPTFAFASAPCRISGGGPFRDIAETSGVDPAPGARRPLSVPVSRWNMAKLLAVGVCDDKYLPCHSCVGPEFRAGRGRAGEPGRHRHIGGADRGGGMFESGQTIDRIRRPRPTRASSPSSISGSSPPTTQSRCPLSTRCVSALRTVAARAHPAARPAGAAGLRGADFALEKQVGTYYYAASPC